MYYQSDLLLISLHTNCFSNSRKFTKFEMVTINTKVNHITFDLLDLNLVEPDHLLKLVLYIDTTHNVHSLLLQVAH